MREREREHKKRVDVPDSRIAENERHKAKQVDLCCPHFCCCM